MGSFIELTATDGFRLAAWRADPAGTPRGAVVIAQEIFGVNSHIQASATATRRTATSRSRRRSSIATSWVWTLGTRPRTSRGDAS